MDIFDDFYSLGFTWVHLGLLGFTFDKDKDKDEGCRIHKQRIPRMSRDPFGSNKDMWEVEDRGLA